MFSFLIDPQGLEASGHLVWREDIVDVDVFVCAPLFALGFLEGSAMGLSFDLLVTGHFQFETLLTSAWSETDALMMDLSNFPSRVLVRWASKQVSPKTFHLQ